MPVRFLSVTRAWRACRAFAAVTPLIALAGCAQTGDFGRPEGNLLTASAPLAGKAAAAIRREPVSWSPMTDDEEELRGRAWRYLMPAHERSMFTAALTQLRISRIFPAVIDGARPRYYNSLTGVRFASLASRYQRLADDVIADRHLIGPFLLSAKRVRDADRVRIAALQQTRDLTQPQAQNATARTYENAVLISWVCHGLSERLAQYRYALEHLVLDGPQQEAVQAERALIAFEQDPRSACQGGPVGPARPDLDQQRGLGQIEPGEARFTGPGHAPPQPPRARPGADLIAK